MDPFQFSVISNSSSTTNAPRLATLKHPKTRIDTPAFMFYTKVPNNKHCLLVETSNILIELLLLFI